MPPFIFVNIIKTSNNDSIFSWNFIFRYEIITALILIISFLISFYLLNNNKKDPSLFALNSTYPNYGYMGIPLSILTFGEAASIPISLILLVDTIVLLSFTSFFSTNNTTRSIKTFYLFFFNLFRNPIIFSVFIGFFIIFNLDINIILFESLEVLSLAATPTALFAIGINLYNKVEKNSYKNISFISLF